MILKDYGWLERIRVRVKLGESFSAEEMEAVLDELEETESNRQLLADCCECGGGAT